MLTSLLILIAIAPVPTTAESETSTTLSPPSCADRAVSDSTEIVVCGRKDARSPYRLPLLDDGKYQRSGKAEVKVGAATAVTELEQKGLGSGFVSHRIMVRLKVPF